MRLWLLAVLGLGALAGVCRAQRGRARPVLPIITNKTFIDACVREHNKQRSAVRPAAANMLYMTWDAALARTARAWAKKCLFKHSPYLTEKYMSHPHYGHVGENIWTGHYGLFGVTEAIKLWTDEVQHYNLQTNKCTKTCGHYTQVVWDNSHKVGCAVVFCRIAAGIRDAAHFVCNYVPSGNYPRKPYKAGSSCSLCSKEDICVDNLCRNPKRDKIIRYTRWYPPWENRIVCDESCIAVVVLRPSLMLLASLVVFLMQKRYSNMSISK
ncbi:glioma pathogenesis-related protein 1-like [Gopherus evgoodei]|uniref:glioma pathogenesis-related protein 1-like n=1 Tax=Gopherus evgoodei TaxID=1825980 RepID=UPI0011CF1096|nr:glioma pathogenesis-related protein 1-like [Gopherus evgoodei]